MTTSEVSRPAAPDISSRGETASAIKNISWNWAGLVANIVISFFLAPFVVRHLGNTNYGIWALLGQFTGYLWLFDFGVRESVIKYVAQYYAKDQRDELVTTIHAAVSLYAVISAIILLAIGGMTFGLPYLFNIPPESVTTARLTLLITGITVAEGFVFNVYVGVLVGIQRIYLVGRIGILLSLPRTLLIVVLLLNGYGIVALATIQFAVTTATNLWVYHLCRVHVPYLTFRLGRPRREDVQKIIDYGKYVLLNNIGEKVVYASDGMIVAAFLPVASLTYYAIPSSLIGYLKAFVSAMAAVLNPMSSALDSTKDHRLLRELFLSSAKAAMLVGMPVCIGFIVLGERFISIWMGPDFGPAASAVLVILAVAHLIGLPYYTISGVLYGLAKHNIIARVRIFEAVVNLGLSVVLVQRYGLVGVAIGTIVPHIVIAAGILPVMLPGLLPVRLGEYYVSVYIRPLVSSIPFWGTCLVIEKVFAPTTFVAFMGLVTGGLVTYAVPCWLFALSRDERRMITARINRAAWRRPG